MKQYYVYTMTNKKNTVLYTGVTNDLERRVYEHKNKLIGGFTKKYNVTKLVFYELTNDVNIAIAREKQIKGWLRKKKIALIESMNPHWKDLGEDFCLPEQDCHSEPFDFAQGKLREMVCHPEPFDFAQGKLREMVCHPERSEGSKLDSSGFALRMTGVARMTGLMLAIALTLVAASCAKSPLRTVASPKPLEQAEQAGVATAPQNQPTQELPNQRVFFPFDSDFILPEEAGLIDQNAGWLEQTSDAYIILEGHCDKMGQDLYNIELGDRRARAVKGYLIEHGISPERIIMVVSYGSMRPLSLGLEIEDMRKNRRVEFVLR